MATNRENREAIDLANLGPLDINHDGSVTHTLTNLDFHKI